jgi:hypothetical protein
MSVPPIVDEMTAFKKAFVRLREASMVGDKDAFWSAMTELEICIRQVDLFIELRERESLCTYPVGKCSKSRIAGHYQK